MNAPEQTAPGVRAGRVWFQTASGRRFYPLEPRPGDVHFPDIAHQLAQRNRFSGACRVPYSVAQHSYLASCYAEKDGRLLGATLDQEWLLRLALTIHLHDAAEAYGPDICRPVKHSGAVDGLVTIEEAIQAAIFTAAGLPPVEPADLLMIRKTIDRRMLRTEQRDLMPPADPDDDQTDAAPYPAPIKAWDWDTARAAWLYRYDTLATALQCAIQ
jgi:5'-deoxynucleotidase YfbR-like HD superfamily hydrolase